MAERPSDEEFYNSLRGSSELPASTFDDPNPGAPMPPTEQALNAALTEEEQEALMIAAGFMRASNEFDRANVIQDLLTRTAEPNAVLLSVRDRKRELALIQELVNYLESARSELKELSYDMGDEWEDGCCVVVAETHHLLDAMCIAVAAKGEGEQ